MSGFNRIIPKDFNAFIEASSTAAKPSTDNSLDEDEFWLIIEKLAWKNASDQKMDCKDIKKKLTGDEIKYLKKYMPQFAFQIEAELSKLGWFIDSHRSDIDNFVCHIVGLGQQFYTNTIIDPTGVAQFIWNERSSECNLLFDALGL